jgi:uncharacterized protein YlxW (UPF0749 family)
MKKLVLIVAALFTMAVAGPAFAEMTKEAKDECLLASKDCANETSSIQQKIKKLNAEIKKGTKVYSAEDIKKLNAKLKEAEDFLDTIIKPSK